MFASLKEIISLNYGLDFYLHSSDVKICFNPIVWFNYHFAFMLQNTTWKLKSAQCWTVRMEDGKVPSDVIFLHFSLFHRSSENLIHLCISWFLPSLIALVTGVARHPQDLCWLVLTLVDPSVCTMLPIQAWLWAASPTEVWTLELMV